MMIVNGKIVDNQIDDGYPLDEPLRGTHEPQEQVDVEQDEAWVLSRIHRTLGRLAGTAAYLTARVKYPFTSALAQLNAMSGDEYAMRELHEMRPPQRSDFTE